MSVVVPRNQPVPLARRREVLAGREADTNSIPRIFSEACVDTGIAVTCPHRRHLGVGVRATGRWRDYHGCGIAAGTVRHLEEQIRVEWTGCRVPDARQAVERIDEIGAA